MIRSKSRPRGLCAGCIDPGHCCRVFSLSAPFNDHPDPDKELKEMGLPFRRIDTGMNEKGDRINDFTCTKLGRDGRCTIYQRRPDTCRQFEAGSDALCVYYRNGRVRPSSQRNA